jgi:hypothetical protein
MAMKALREADLLPYMQGTIVFRFTNASAGEECSVGYADGSRIKIVKAPSKFRSAVITEITIFTTEMVRYRQAVEVSSAGQTPFPRPIQESLSGEDELVFRNPRVLRNGNILGLFEKNNCLELTRADEVTEVALQVLRQCRDHLS